MKVIFLDRDGTLNEDKGYTYKIDDFKLVDGVVDGLIKLKNDGFEFIIVTNQSGIGRELYSEKDMKIFNNYLVEFLKNEGITFLGIYYCPHRPDDNCLCRKPKIGLFKEIKKDYPLIKLEKSYMIGDNLSDLDFGNKIGVKTILLGNNKKDDNIKPDFVVKDLIEAAEVIRFIK